MKQNIFSILCMPHAKPPTHYNLSMPLKDDEEFNLHTLRDNWNAVIYTHVKDQVLHIDIHVHVHQPQALRKIAT